MKKILLLAALAGASIGLLVNWTTQETTIAGDKKHRVNFFGILETQEGNRYEVENISIGLRYKQIPLYEAPKEIPKNLMLTKDPRKGLIAKIDLAEVTEFQISNFDKKLIYQKKGSSKNEYIKIVVIFKDEEKTKRQYLIDLRRKLECDEINKAGPIELESLSFSALKRLIIKGYRYREPEQDTETKKRKA